MILAFDTYYYSNKAKTVCLKFENWTDSKNYEIFFETIESKEEYQSGLFYKKELPCIVHLLKSINLVNIDFIVVDSFVILNDEGQIGLGGYLYEFLEQKIPIIGVAKTNYAQNKLNKKELYRGNSIKPLYITSLGVGLDEACGYIASMFGENRMPFLLKLVDTLTKENLNEEE